MINVACDVCGRVVQRKPSDVSRAKHSTCSDECRIKRHSETMAERRIDAATRFDAHVERSEAGCWLWIGNKYKNGYGQFYVSLGQAVSAHRFSYESAHGPIPRGLLVCHHCDNRRCVRPDHLFLGTAQDNTRDMFRKGRARPNKLPPYETGERHKMAKLTEANVAEIREMYKGGGISQPAIAAKFGVSRSAIQLIVTGKRWTHQTASIAT